MKQNQCGDYSPKSTEFTPMRNSSRPRKMQEGKRRGYSRPLDKRVAIRSMFLLLGMVMMVVLIKVLDVPPEEVNPVNMTRHTYTTTEAVSAVPSVAEIPTQIPKPSEFTTQSSKPTLHLEGGEAITFTPALEEHEIAMLAQTVWGEARGCSPDEQRLVVWTIFQRVDKEFGDSVGEVITQPNQFAGYSESYPVDPDIYELCREEAGKWESGQAAPILAPYANSRPYLFFDGDGTHNWFREEYLK